jgi:iron complex outermembrane recepter protein
MTNRAIACAVRRALWMSAVATLGANLPVEAQEQSEQRDDQTVVVTGTRLVTPNLEAISPVAAITAEDMGLTGKVRIEDIINQLPQAFAAQGAAISNDADGTATVDLRGLGDERTLVLVNGRRLMPGDPDGGNAADLNTIPLPLVKRVDVLTGGASSVYGADAVAGVVNFIMDNEFQGIKLEANYSWNQHRNDNSVAQIVADKGFATPPRNVNTGYTRDITFALGLGGPDQPGHATFYAAYRKVDAVLQGMFDYSACTFNSGDVFTCGGSGTTNPARFMAVDVVGAVGDANEIASDTTIGAANVLRPYTSADEYNFGPLNYYQRPDERYTAGVFMDFDATETVHAYGELMFMDDRSIAQIAPSGSFLGVHDVNCGNPLLSPSQIQTFCTDLGLGPDDFTTLLIGRRNVEGGGRQDDIGHQSYRVVAGLRGELTSDWSWDAYFQHGTTERSSTSLNDFSIARTDRSLQVALDDRLDASGAPLDPNTFGTPQCLSFIDGSDPNCVPWNIFQLDGVTPAALAYLQTPGLIRAEATQRVAHADVTGDLTRYIKLPTAENGLALNVGLEWRSEKTEFRPDTAFATGDLAGQGGATLPTLGGYHVKETFMEARLPLVEDKPAAKSVAVETGYRYSDYDIGFKTDTYKFGLGWAPVDALRFRGSFQHAVRAPSVGELFSPATVLLDGNTDPCDGTPEATLEQCLRTGMTASQYGSVPENPAAQYNGLLGGNPNVQPEKSDTVSFGVVLQPTFVPNLLVSLDYFDIDIENTISDLDGGNADAYINQCLETGEASFCDRIHRDAFGSLWLTPAGFISDTSDNIARLGARGIDMQATYRMDLAGHRLAFNLVGSRLEKSEKELVEGVGAFDCTGLFGGSCGVPNAKWRHSLRTTWQTPWRGLDVSMGWRFIGAVDLETTSSNPQLQGEVPATDARLASRSYIDVTAAIKLLDNYTLRLGANNLLDKDPPLVGQDNCPDGICNGNTFAQVYDVLGRQWFATVTVDF